MEVLPEVLKKTKTKNKEKLENLEGEIKACENIMKAQKEQLMEKSEVVQHPTTTKLKTELKETMDKRFVSLEKKVDQIFEKMYSDSCKEQLTNYEITYADITKKSTAENTATIKEILKSKKIEERKIKETESNLIIHGVDESMEETKEEMETNDKDFIENKMMKKMGLQVDIVKLERIGKYSDEREQKQRYRPINILLKNVETKLEILQNLKKLKGFDVRITEDLTKRERKLCSEWKQKAEKMNENNGDKSFKWRVRGSPRSGLYIKKVYCNKSI